MRGWLTLFWLRLQSATLELRDCVFPYFVDLLALFLFAAQRLSCAWRIFSRASALMVRRFVFAGAVAAELVGRPGPRFAGVPMSINSILACRNRAISASICLTMLSLK